MEPMTLGSPAGSPPNPCSGTPGTPFLPAYLMGETLPSAISRVNPSSPTKTTKQVSFGTIPTPSPAKQHPSAEPKNLRSSVSMERSSGPPTKCLFDTLDESYATPKSTHSTERSFRDLHASVMGAASLHDKSVPASPHNGEWVTVFGFPPSSISFIAAQFSQCGMIIDKRIPAKGNWIHLRFSSTHEAHKALKYNGKIFSGSTMIGVVPYNGKDLGLDSPAKENLADSCSLRSPGIASPPSYRKLGGGGSGVLSHSNSSNFSYLGSPVRIGNTRPLSQTYRPGQSETEGPTHSNTPQKSTSMVTKAMEYVFGW